MASQTFKKSENCPCHMGQTNDFSLSGATLLHGRRQMETDGDTKFCIVKFKKFLHSESELGQYTLLLLILVFCAQLWPTEKGFLPFRRQIEIILEDNVIFRYVPYLDPLQDIV